jgi:phosphate transport system substrate-binding protein
MTACDFTIKLYNTVIRERNDCMKLKKILMAAVALSLAATSMAGCSKKTNETITVISREDGSGTRGAFIELLKIEEKDENGKKVDKTISDAVIAEGTDVVLTQVSNDKNAIGYISLGSVKDSIKALKIDGVVASSENVKNGSYPVARPFNIATKGDISETAQDFINFIMSKEGQAVVAKSYIAIDDNAPAYSGTKPSGKVVIAGSSSVTPVMEKLKEAYAEVNPNAEIEVQMSDSTAGMQSAIDGICEIGMASRELKDSEKAELSGTAIALDGIAVIVNTENSLSDISSEDIKKIYTGEIKTWSDIK